jgi:hypothetical protein
VDIKRRGLEMKQELLREFLKVSQKVEVERHRLRSLQDVRMIYERGKQRDSSKRPIRYKNWNLSQRWPRFFREL